MNTNHIKVFTWGYWGWGNSTPELVQAVDEIERSRNYSDPIFVDIRISRAVRAKGFQGDAFALTVGESRYRWIQALGNETPSGPGIKIRDPRAITELLDCARQARDRNARILFFCACEFPYEVGHESACHRATVAKLLLEHAAATGVSVAVAEWPGGAPSDERRLSVEVSSKIFKAVIRGNRRSVPLPNDLPPVAHLGAPWGSILTVTCGDSPHRVVCGPARRDATGWFHPVIPEIPVDALDANRRIVEWRRLHGFERHVSS